MNNTVKMHTLITSIFMTLVFVALKISGTIAWSWVSIFTPLYVYGVLFLAAFVIQLAALIVLLVVVATSKKVRK